MIPQGIELKTESKVLHLTYADGAYSLDFEFLRVHSPSAEVKGHGNLILQHGKKSVRIVGIEQAGNYALKLIFDDGHDSGLYTWDYLRELCENKSALWAKYLSDIEAAKLSR